MNDKIVVFTLEDGCCHIMYPTQEGIDLFGLEGLIERDKPVGTKFHRVTTVDQLPTDRDYRDAWTDALPTTTVDINMDKAKNIHLDRLRRERDEELKKLDIETFKAYGTKNDVKLQEIEEKKQKLRDMPDKFSELAIDTVEQLKSVKLEDLK